MMIQRSEAPTNIMASMSGVYDMMNSGVMTC